MTAFQKAFSTHEATFLADGTHFLILRLRHFVIKTALRTITLAYSRISLRDICFKLRLDSEEDTEYIVAKAIKDGVIDASIDHQGRWMQSRVAKDVYETDEPQKQFNLRVNFCTSLYNESVRVGADERVSLTPGHAVPSQRAPKRSVLGRSALTGRAGNRRGVPREG